MRLAARPRSLRVRLLAGTLAWVVLALALAGWGLRELFRDHITQQLQQQLVVLLDQLSATLDWEPGAGVTLAPGIGDPRLGQPLSGLYWQVDELGDLPLAGLLRSRSLWDQLLPLPPAPQRLPAPGYRVLRLQGNDGVQLLTVVRTLQLPADEAPPLRIAAAADQALLAEPLRRFTRMLLAALMILGFGLAAAVVVQLQLALQPLRRLQRGLAAVRRGAAPRMEGSFPIELQPLLGEFNRVLAENADIVQRARAQAGNLAHAVNTPLSVLANAAQGQDGALAELVREQTRIARRQVDRNLARARATAAVRATGLCTPVQPPLRALLRTMQRLHAERGVEFSLAAVPADAAFAGEEQDFYELLGNLLDNAGKWARSIVRVEVQQQPGWLLLSVDDDGPGVSPGERERILQRGARLDENRPGAGLGLDIVRDLAEAYRGELRVEGSALGGARLVLRLPAVD